jgi:hypothetical protein
MICIPKEQDWDEYWYHMLELIYDKWTTGAYVRLCITSITSCNLTGMWTLRHLNLDTDQLVYETVSDKS